MIAVTSNAARAVRRMTNTDTYPDAGLSIRKIDDKKFAFSIVPAPADSDVAVPGTNVYLDQPAAAALKHATLDADANATLARHLILDKATSSKP
ncbi:hypothetical protein [Micromonospora sp. CPCC 206061]|uniref:hypothetical protein n=1 Tax=Micromonospora sp. CPCC 206061 TaxID=3122410 RepID=UPI002FF2D813